MKALPERQLQLGVGWGVGGGKQRSSITILFKEINLNNDEECGMLLHYDKQVNSILPTCNHASTVTWESQGFSNDQSRICYSSHGQIIQLLVRETQTELASWDKGTG